MVDESPANKWECEWCTFRNDMNKTHCWMCLNRRTEDKINEDSFELLATKALNRFGYTSFKPLQNQAIQSLIKGDNTMLISNSNISLQ